MIDPLFPHLLDIVSDPASEGLILAGGFGIRLKQAYLRETGERTLISVIPDARATQDLDFFLSLALFVQQERGAAVRALLDRLGYAEYTPKYQFGKPFDAEQPALKVKVDLLARLPTEKEDVRVKSPRVGAGSGIDLHGRETPEGFAVEDHPLRLMVHGTRSDGVEVEGKLLVPHPYAWINLKIKAAHDWLRMERGEIAHKPRSERHVFDVYVLIAMLTEIELAVAEKLAQSYAAHPEARRVAECAQELFGRSDASGALEILRQIGDSFDYTLFYEGLGRLLGA